MTPFHTQGSDTALLNRRDFLGRSAQAAAGVAAAGSSIARAAENAEKTESAGKLPNAQDLPNKGQPIKIFCCDFNWCLFDAPSQHVTLSAPQDWAFVNPEEYFNWHRDFGVNCMFCQAYTHT